MVGALALVLAIALVLVIQGALEGAALHVADIVIIPVAIIVTHHVKERVKDHVRLTAVMDVQVVRGPAPKYATRGVEALVQRIV